MHQKVVVIDCVWWTSAVVRSKGEEPHVKILAARIPDNAIITWRSATHKMRRGNPVMITPS